MKCLDLKKCSSSNSDPEVVEPYSVSLSTDFCYSAQFEGRSIYSSS